MIQLLFNFQRTLDIIRSVDIDLLKTYAQGMHSKGGREP